MKWIALYINCTVGVFEAFGPFDSEDEADEWIMTQRRPDLMESTKVIDPTDPPPARET